MLTIFKEINVQVILLEDNISSVKIFMVLTYKQTLMIIGYIIKDHD
jgi:hypothetical protein